MPIRLDPFQTQAISWVEKEQSVLVCAPTGSGKTLIAEAAIEKALSRGEQVIYTAPIKALSNQKYRDFCAQYGENRVGILTGDVSINPGAPIVIMTTEIYRNSLFENLEHIQKVGWVIFDEVHYLDDPERGTVWEEALLFTPEKIRILALSATAPNIAQLADWAGTIHEQPIAVIKETSRPVPLHFLFQCQGKIFETMKQLRHAGYFNRDNWRLSRRDMRRGMRPLRAKPNRLDHLLCHLVDKNRLPAIYFAFGRRRTEILATEASRFDFLNESERRQIIDRYRSLLVRYDLKHEKSAQELSPLIAQGIAYHHAGMLPTLKETVEQLFTRRLIKLIFTTETFALGINMPARSVIFDELEKFYGTRFRNLTTRDFYQMAGRAGRRGMDPEGFVYVRIHPNDISFSEVERILYGNPEPIRSQFNAAYATLLNLYRSLGEALLDIYSRSFHYFQSPIKKREEGLDLIRRKLDLLRDLGYLAKGKLTPKGEFAASIFGYELMISEMHEDGMFENLDETSLNMILSGLVFEPRKGDSVTPRFGSKIEFLRKKVESYWRSIYRKEFRSRISPYTKPPHFHLAPAVDVWTQGATFAKTLQMTHADEGELVRHIRMIIQLLREILNASHVSETLRKRAEQARRLINRDVVDAEKQLRA
ncbi:MAG: DEAD/DEAH box helicase [Candidatus Omnitrophica bacterium]|nr:DEAD/DEAH box helicase [Candidatus Omnitrophota bacterium]